MHFFRYAFAVATVVTMACAASALPPLTGQWGGDHVRLTLDEKGGRIEYDCGAGTMDAPVRPATDGGFAVNGKHEEYKSGPTTADSAPPSLIASYRGRVDGDRMTLSVRVAGEKTERNFSLVRGRSVKLIRCL